MQCEKVLRYVPALHALVNKGIVYVMAMGTIVCAHVSAAQSPTPADPRIPLPSDTGHLMRGHADFSRYETPHVCAQVGPAIVSVLTRSAGPEIRPYAERIRDTLPTIARDAARECAKRFRVESLDESELAVMARLALWIGDDSLIGAVVTHRFRTTRTPSDSAELAVDLIDAYMAATPVYVDSALALLRRLDALGNEARTAKVRAHARMLRHWRMMFDQTRMRQSAEAIVNLYPVMTQDERDWWYRELESGYWTLLDLAALEDPSTLPALIERTEREFLTLRKGRGKLPAGSVMKYVTHQRLLGTPVPPIEVSLWSPDTLSLSKPEPGTVSLILTVNQNGGSHAYPLYAMIRRLHAKYANRGLRIVLLQRTAGFTRWSVSGPQRVEEEAETARWYFLEHLKLPVTLAIQGTQFSHIPDGRRVAMNREEPTLALPLIGTMLVDDAGLLRYLAIGTGGEGEIEAYVDKTLAR